MAAGRLRLAAATEQPILRRTENIVCRPDKEGRADGHVKLAKSPRAGSQDPFGT
jgi:hypothetical protein